MFAFITSASGLENIEISLNAILNIKANVFL